VSVETERGRCPICRHRISLWQAVWYGGQRPFTCRKCGGSIEKTSSRYFVAAPLIAVALLLANRVGVSSPIFWGGIVLACVIIALDGLFLGPVRRSRPAVTD